MKQICTWGWERGTGHFLLSLETGYLGTLVKHCKQSQAALTSDLSENQHVVLMSHQACTYSGLHFLSVQAEQDIIFIYSLFYTLYYPFRNSNSGRLTWVRLQQPQEQSYPVLQVHAGSFLYP